MTTTFGLTDAGFLPMGFSDILTDLQVALQDAFGASIDIGDKSILGQIVGILTERYALLWELAQTVYSANDPDAATGAALDAISALTGTQRPQASFSTVTLTLTGVASTPVSSGNTAAATSTGTQFSTSADATIASVSAWSTVAYAIGDRVTNGGNVYQCTTAGTSAASGPSGTGTGITDGGGVVWAYLGAGTGAVDVDAACTVTGDIIAAARDITTQITSVSGWSSVINVADATPGRDVALDSELRQLREAELSGDGSPADAIRAALLAITDVISVTVFMNLTDAEDDSVSPAMPPHSVEALVRTVWSPGDPKDQQIYDTLLANVSAGIVTTGGTSGTSMDSQGTDWTIKFSRPTEIPIYVIVNVTTDATQYPTDGTTQIQDAIVTWGDNQATGKDAVASAIIAQVFSVDGVLDATVYIGTAPSPASSTTIAIDDRQLATYSTTNITVTATPGTP